ncbi:hypothetical protein [Streptomyces sp. 900105755]
MITDADLEAAYAAVPEIDEAARRLHAAKELSAGATGPGVSPEEARNAVFDEAADAFMSGGEWPKDLARRARKAFDETESASLDFMARRRAVERAELALYEAQIGHSSAALEHLGKRLDDVLSDARSAFEALRGANSAEAAIDLGGDAVEAWTRLRKLTGDLKQVRELQWAILRGPRLPGGGVEVDTPVHRWRTQGCGHVRGLNPNDMPAFAREAIRTGNVTREFLQWTASQDAYVPKSAEEMEAEIAATMPNAFEDDTWVSFEEAL